METQGIPSKHQKTLFCSQGRSNTRTVSSESVESASLEIRRPQLVVILSNLFYPTLSKQGGLPKAIS